MAQIHKHAFWLYAVTLAGVSALGTACKESNVLLAPEATPSPSATAAPIGIVDDSAGFYVTVVPNEKYTYKVHEGDGSLSADATPDDWSKPCQVTSTSASKSINCVVEANELDLYFHGVELHYNVPSNMCSYVMQRQPYYYAWKPGTGPTLFTVDNRTVTPTITVTGNGGTYDGAPICYSNYADAKNPYSNNADGPNCCVGSYTVRTIEPPAEAGGSDTVSDAPGEWGGTAGSCLAGPAVDNLTLDEDGFPKSVLYYVESLGLNSSYKVTAPIQTNRTENYYVANYFKASEHAGGRPAAFSSFSTPAPNVVSFPSLWPYHSFYCMDRAGEVLAQITVSVREWNEVAEFDLGVAGDPDTTGAESNPAFQLNDHNDWKDLEAYVNKYPAHPY